MNKLKVIGASALCGSLAAISAQAGELTVSGGLTTTYTTNSHATTGQALGMASGMTFSGSGELDGGSVVSANIYHDDQNAFSSADIGVDIAGVGKITFDQGGGTGLDRLDDKMPTAWEESYDAGAGSSIKTATGVGGGVDIEWAISSDYLPEGMSAYISYAPKGTATVNDKAYEGDPRGQDVGAGYDIVVEHSMAEGLNVFAGMSDQNVNNTVSDQHDDKTSWVLGATYAMGGFTVGYQGYKEEGVNGVDHYENAAFGISFAVNDDLSVSYGQHESEKDSDGTVDVVEVSTKSLQAAYSMGGASFKIARTDVDNAGYSTAADKDYDVNTIAVSMAF
jgi:outer membrane protein OmpU